MDVIADELRRQAALWRVLTTGETTAAQEKAEPGDKPPDPAGGRETGNLVRSTGKAAEPVGGIYRPGETGGAASAVLRAGTAGTGVPAGQGRSAAAAEWAPLTGRDSESLYFWEESPAAEPARALSRLFERDARRYDGGFFLY